MTRPLQTKSAVAVVTGGAGGIGAAFCARLLSSGAAHVVVADLDDERVRATVADLRAAHSHAKVSALVLDVTDESAVSRAVENVISFCGRLDLWFSNAGVSIGKGLGTPNEWTLALGVNVLGHAHAARHVIPAMAAQGGGHFIVTSSAAGLLSDFRSAPYSASKHAAVALAEWLAITHGADGVGVSCICPEGVRTQMTRESSAKAASGMEFLTADEMAERSFVQLEAGKFLILPHPRVAEFERRRADDRERWIAGMSKARQRMADASAPEKIQTGDPK